MKVQLEKEYILVISATLTKVIGYLAFVGPKAKGAALWPFLFVKSKEFLFSWLVMHERIHFRQQLELLFIGSFLLRIFERLYAVIILRKSWFDSYLWVSAEQEAYLNQHDFEYLSKRKFWNQFHYLQHKKNFKLGKPGEITFT